MPLDYQVGQNIVPVFLQNTRPPMVVSSIKPQAEPGWYLVEFEADRDGLVPKPITVFKECSRRG